MNGKRRIGKAYLAAVLMFAGVMWTGMILSYGAEPSDQAVRTILLYGCGSDLEDDEGGFLSRNLRQILNARIRPDTHIIVMTGGSETWQLEPEYLDGADGIQNDEKQRHQIWECSGADADGNHGRLKLLGTVPDTVTKSMSDPATLQSFIDYGAANYPAEKYDLICWDHGGGPAGGYALDNLDGEERAFMPVDSIVSAVKNSAVVNDTESGRFELIDFDACLMGNAEIVTGLAPYTDYYVGSAEIVPAYGQEYTTWLNRLYDDPDMDGYTLGREIVDAFHAFYSQTGEEWTGFKATLAVVDTHNYMTRMLPLLKEMTGILQSEAFDQGAVNGKYNFYDELIVSSGSITYGKGEEGLIDLGDFVSRIGVCLTEPDNESAQEREDLRNRYTGTAVELIRILGDQDFSGDDVIYSRASKSRERLPDYELTRDGEGELTVSIEPVIPGGLSFLFGGSMSGKVPDYVESLNALCSGLAEDSLARGFFDDLKKTALEYAVVMDTGSLISGLSFRKENISYDSVMDELKGQSYRLDDFFRLAESEGLENPDDWIRQVIEQQVKEVIREENIFVEAFGTAGQNARRGYYVTIRNSSLKIVDSVRMQMLVGLRDGEDKGQMLELGRTKASIALKKMQPEAEEWEDPLAAAFQSGFCIFEAEMPEPEWYELSCDEGRYVIALEPEEAGNGTCAIPVKLIRQDMTDEDLPEYGVLEAMREADETLRIVGYRRFDRTPQPTVPLNNDSLDGAKMILIGNVLTEEGESEVELGGPIRLTEEEGRGLSVVRKPISQIRGLDADRVLATGEVCDIYFHEYDITGKMRKADGM